MIVGFNFTKILVEKKNSLQGKIQIKHNVDIKDVVESALPLKEKKQALIVDFLFSIHYLPHAGDITLGGNVIYFHDDAKKITSIRDQWKRNKKIPPDVSVEILNVIFARCNVKALELATDINLPPHLPLPKINLKEDPRQYIG